MTCKIKITVTYNLWVDGKLMIEGESYSIVNQVRDILEGKDGPASGEAREIAKSIMRWHATRSARELEAAVEEILCYGSALMEVTE